MSRVEPNVRTGWLTFSAIVLILAGVHNFVSGVSALHNSTYFGSQILYGNLDVWGWILILWGIAQVAFGVAAMQERPVGIYVGIGLASVGCIIWFFFLFSSPTAGLIGVVMNLLVIYGFTAYGRSAGTLN